MQDRVHVGDGSRRQADLPCWGVNRRGAAATQQTRQRVLRDCRGLWKLGSQSLRRAAEAESLGAQFAGPLKHRGREVARRQVEALVEGVLDTVTTTAVVTASLA